MTNDQAIDTLNHLIAIAKDGHNGMSSAAESARNPQLKTTLETLSQERDRVADELQQLVRRLGGEPDDSGTALGATHRAFMNVKDAVTGRDDHALVEECERGEDTAVKEFSEALQKNLPPEARSLVESSFSRIKSSHDRFRAMKQSRQFS